MYSLFRHIAAFRSNKPIILIVSIKIEEKKSCFDLFIISFSLRPSFFNAKCLFQVFVKEIQSSLIVTDEFITGNLTVS